MTQTRWGLGSGPVLLGALAASLVIAGCGGGGGASESPSADPSSTASTSPAISASPAPTPSPAPSGFLPVDSLGGSEIPWDEVGPGWFLVDWAQRDAVWAEEDIGSLTVSPADASVSLLAPNGTWYAARSLTEVESDRTLAWLGETVAVFRTTVAEYDYSLGDTSLLNLRTGAARLVSSGAEPPAWDGVSADGTIHGNDYAEESSWYVRYNDRFEPQTVCEGDSASVAPDGVRVACLGWVTSGDATSDQTQVLLGSLSTGAEADVIDTFRLDPWSYEIRGWIDQDTFLLLRRDPQGEAFPTYFAYNVATRKIADFALPFQATGDRVAFDWVTKTYTDVAEHSTSFFAADGAKVAEVSCAGMSSWWSPIHSGSRALVSCETLDAHYSPTGATLTLVDLVDGTTTVVAEVPETSEQRVRTAYPYVGNLD